MSHEEDVQLKIEATENTNHIINQVNQLYRYTNDLDRLLKYYNPAYFETCEHTFSELLDVLRERINHLMNVINHGVEKAEEIKTKKELLYNHSLVIADSASQGGENESHSS